MERTNENSYGYIRVSTKTQELNGSRNFQTLKLLEWGVPQDNIIYETGSGLNDFQQRLKLTEFVNQYDYLNQKEFLEIKKKNEISQKSLVCVSLDRISRDLVAGMTIQKKLSDAGIELIALNAPILKNEPVSKIIFALLFWVAEYEISSRREKQASGIKAASLLGKYKHRKKSKLSEATLLEIDKKLARGLRGSEIYKSLAISKSSFYSAKKILESKKKV